MSRTTSPRTIVTLHVTPPPPPLSSHHPLRPPSPHLATTTKASKGVLDRHFNSPVEGVRYAYKTAPKGVFGSGFNSPYRAVWSDRFLVVVGATHVYFNMQGRPSGRIKDRIVDLGGSYGRIQQFSKGLSEGSDIIPEIPDEPKDNSGSSSNSLSGSNDNVQDVSSDEENKADENKADAEVAEKQARNEQPLSKELHSFDTVISMVTEKTTSIPLPPTTQAQVTNVSESDSPLKFEQRISELEKKVEAMSKRAWTEKHQQWTDEMLKMIDNLLLERWIMRSLE
ncbi:hypothetical protein Tco_0464619 [Tanacetum coccineum]